MALVAAKCTQCGANIEIDDTHEAGICKYCGTAFITEKAINNYNTYITNNFSGANINVVGGDINNFIKMAENAIEAGNGTEAIEYVNKALEISPESSHAWFVKMKAVEHTATIGDSKETETTTYGEKAIKFASEEEKENVANEVYKYYLARANTIMLIAIAKMNDTEQIKQLSRISVSGVAQGDTTTRNLYLNMSTAALAFKSAVPEEYIKNNEEFQDSVSTLAKAYGTLCESDAKRLKIYGSKLLPEALESRRAKLKLFKAGLPEEKAAEITNEKVSTNTNPACYVATCVYGSYDCPEVWTLRRFRDYELDETWHGKLFIKCYYAISPTIVNWFGNTKWFKKFWKSRLDKFVYKLNEKGVSNTSYIDKY